MSMLKNPKKLVLNRTTLRRLSADELARVNGADNGNEGGAPQTDTSGQGSLLRTCDECPRLPGGGLVPFSVQCMMVTAGCPANG